jgi:hypothetical protein
MVERKVRCLNCNREWLSKAAKPRCSRCDSRNVEDVRIEATPPSPSPSPQNGTDYSKVFTAFDEGKTLIDVVKQDLCDPDKALELWNKYEEFKKKTLEIEGRPLLEERVDELENQLSDLQNDLQKLSNVSSAREKKNTSTHNTMFGVMRGIQDELSALRSNICPNCRQPAVALLVRCRNCGAQWEKPL